MTAKSGETSENARPPVALRVIHGGKYGETARAKTPTPARRVLPRCPDYLTGAAAACWKRTARDLYDAGLLGALDRDALALYCNAYARWREAEAVLAREGEVVRGPVKRDADGEVVGGGQEVQHPMLTVAAKAVEHMLKLLGELGMTPSARSRVRITKPPVKSAVKAAVDLGDAAAVADVLAALAT